MYRRQQNFECAPPYLAFLIRAASTTFHIVTVYSDSAFVTPRCEYGFCTPGGRAGAIYDPKTCATWSSATHNPYVAIILIGLFSVAFLTWIYLSNRAYQDLVNTRFESEFGVDQCLLRTCFHKSQDHYKAVRDQLAEAVKGLKKGDPKDEDTFIGPLIAEKEAVRIEGWVNDAVSKGERSRIALN